MVLNRQFGELPSMVRTLAEKKSNGKEENGQNVRNIETSLRSDICHFVPFKNISKKVSYRQIYQSWDPLVSSGFVCHV